MHQTELWQKEAARLGGESLVQVIVDIREDQQKILARLDGMDERHKIAELNLAKLNLAFPGGDSEGHRRYHELMIERNADIRRLRMAIQEKTLSGLIWAGLVLIALSVWNYAKAKTGQGG